MNLLQYNLKKIKLIDNKNNIFEGVANYCNKEDYETEEDGIELLVDEYVTIFYVSDIKKIEVI